ncbi:hypothetical protein C9374_010982 [Naegleria lovaniensis]|uniref:Peptidase C1A papain C-terminal domain-containing protein n=1 Tax=Naegleria lovaniensis TaxID=51637 RepID=A0AA88GA07_NAELO|nr:uncharacterized protein C9374_010982 [Naegleria lovaniensis]KAG2374145.1 hypothetical protein C9374_010982 [Naegleria lovaniensis]
MIKSIASFFVVVLFIASLSLCLDFTPQSTTPETISEWQNYFLRLIHQVNSIDSTRQPFNTPGRLGRTWLAAPNRFTQFPQNYLKLIQNRGMLSSRKDLIEKFSLFSIDQIGKFGFEHLRVVNELLKRAERNSEEIEEFRNNVEELRRIQLERNIPETFDSRVQWPSCIHPIRDQGNCGSCYAFASTEVMSDRFCIFSNSSVNVVLSPQDLISCSWYSFGCDGGIPGLVFDYIHKDGVVSDACLPYLSYNGNTEHHCPSYCFNNSSKLLKDDKYFAKSVYHVGSFIENKEERMVAIQQEILQNGPVNADYMVFQDFMTYKSGVYRHLTGSFSGIHAVKIIGWGVENDIPYWLVANSWGTNWGFDGGHFKILRGHDECGIEFSIYTLLPAL